MHNTVCIDIERNLDLRYTAGCRGDPCQLECTQRLVVAGEFALALIYLDQHAWLVILCRREDFRALGRNSGIPVDQLGHDPALGLNTEAQRCHINKQDVGAVPLDNA